MARLALAGALVIGVACQPQRHQHAHAAAAMRTSYTPTTTTSTTRPPRVSRSQPRRGTVIPPPAAAGEPDDAFWRRLANCESADGRSGRYLGFFQFSRDTARKVGWFDGATYADQLAMAKRWLAMIGGRGGSSAGWPVCWWRALRAA